jgi:hypothetical protein
VQPSIIVQVTQSNAPMLFSHMCVTEITLRERLHALPADVRLTPPASHMIASLRLLQSCLAFGAVLDAQLFLDLLQKLSPTGSYVFVLGTSHAIVMGIVARLAGHGQTVGAGIVCARSPDAVDLLTVG